MKTLFNFRYVLVFILIAGQFSSCKKKDVDPTVGFSVAVQKVAPQATIDALRKLGMTINEGTTPPNVAGIFLESPTILMATFASDTRKVGLKALDYTYKFYDPSTDNSTIKVSYKTSAGDNATGLGSVVSGNGSKFTIFSELTTNAGDVFINIISGEMTSTGIKDWQDSFVRKTELENISIWKDGDGFSESKTSFRFSATSEDKENLLLKGK